MLHARRIVFAAILALSACVTDQGQEPVDNNQPVSQILSAQDLDIYLRTTPNSPLDRLSSEAKQLFIDSLVFTENGLGSFRYVDLAALSPTEIYQILSLFGVERTTSLVTKAPVSSGIAKPVIQQSAPADHVGYWCSGRATCSESASQICMSSC